MNKSNKEITDAILAQTKDGNIPWVRPWTGGIAGADPRRMAVSHSTGRAYSFLNQMLVGGVGEYATFKQIKDCGGRVKKGAKAKHVYFWSSVSVKAKTRDGSPVLDEDGNETYRRVWYLKPYCVFDVQKDAEGVDPVRLNKILEAEKAGESGKDEKIDKPEDVMRNYLKREGIGFEEYGNEAFYRPSTDSITVPPRGKFKGIAAFYGTVFHEIGHSTGAEKRLARKMGGGFGSYDYGKEELVAEMTSAFICATLGLPQETRQNAAYIKSWMKAISEDENMVVYAASKAEKAVEFILTGKKPERKAEEIAA